MKYILFDTNIYLNMLVNRKNNINTKKIADFALLIEEADVKIILPEIVKFETKKHLENEVKYIKVLLEEQINGIEKLYWFTETQNDNINIDDYKHKSIKPLKELISIFDIKQTQYLQNINESINIIFNSNCIINIESDSKLINLTMKRQIFKRAPLHKVNKDSRADGLIIETLINIKNYIDLKENDIIYFVTENYKDFAMNKSHREKFHPNIEEDLSRSGILSQVILINNFSNLISNELTNEIANAKMELIFRDEIRDDNENSYIDYLENEARESVGLRSLSSYQEYMEEYVNESDEAGKIIELFEEIDTIRQNISELWESYDDILGSIQFEDLTKEIIDDFCVNLGEETTGLSNEEFNDKILSFMQETEIDFQSFPDCLNVGEDVVIINPYGKEFTLRWRDNELDPISQDTHTVYLILSEGEKIVSTSQIELVYGFMEFDDDNNAGDGCEDEIGLDFADIITSIDDMVSEYVSFVDKHESILSLLMKINK